jgi:hypothetical protein
MEIGSDQQFSARSRQPAAGSASGKARIIEQKDGFMRLFSASRLLTFGLVLLMLVGASVAQVGISITIGPPPLPVYEQPPCPAEDYLWTPGYWAYGPDDYYWVPGTWVLAPEPGYLWTPAWWGWGGRGYIFHEGYWGPVVGFYGGIPYGYGYFGHGYEGGRWQGNRFYYNRSVTNVNVTNIHNVYNTTVINNTTVNRVSYNGGNGGIDARPTREEEAAERERHVLPTPMQTQHAEEARADPQLRASVNHGRPPVAATPRPGAFRDHAAVPAREAGGPYRPEAEGGGNTSVPRPGNNVPRPPIHARDVPPHPRPAPPNTGDPKLDRKYQQQQDKLYAKQEQEHQRLEQKQEQDHGQLARQNADQTRQQQVEQRHQQQTQQMEQKHAQQWDRLQSKQEPANRNQFQHR